MELRKPMNYKKILVATTAAMMLTGSMTAFGATMDDVQMKNGSEYLTNLINNDAAIKRIPDEVMKYFTQVGGEIEFKDRLHTQDGVEAEGIYWTDNNIEISTATVDAGFPNMLPYNLTHEIGHFVYFNGTLTDEDNAVLNEYYNRMHGRNFDVTSTEEGFAAAYNTLKNGGYGLSEAEKNMLKRVEQSVVEKYLVGSTDRGPGSEITSNYHYRGTWSQEDGKWVYTEYGNRLTNTWALIYLPDNDAGTRMWYHFDANGHMDAEQSAMPDGATI